MTSGALPSGLIARLAARTWACVLLIFVISAALRCAVAFWLPREIVWVDGHRYVAVAQNLLEGRGFGSLYDNRLSVPTQPLLIAGIELMFGQSVIALRLFFAALGAATCVLGYALAKELFDPVVALIAGALLAIYPYYIYLFALFEYPQPFFIFAMGLAFLMLYRFVRTRHVPLLLLAGICLGLGILSVPTALVFVPILFVSLWFARVPQVPRIAAILLMAIAVPVGAWTLRNYIAYGQFILVNQAAGANFWVANNATYFEFGKNAVVLGCAPGYERTQYCEQSRDLNDRLAAANLSDRQAIAAYEAASWRAGWQFVRESPLRSAVLSVRKVLELWSPTPDATTAGRANGGGLKDWISISSYTPVLLLAVVGIILLARQTRRLLPIYGYFLTFTAVYAVFLPTTRYRLPLDFFLIIFAAYAHKRGGEIITLRFRRSAHE